jgi:hypothetical protein
MAYDPVKTIYSEVIMMGLDHLNNETNTKAIASQSVAPTVKPLHFLISFANCKLFVEKKQYLSEL